MSEEEKEICTSTIITIDANEILKPFHHRMPVIILKEKHNEWLNPSIDDKADLLSLLKPFPSEEMELFEVTPRVNSPGYNSPNCIKPAI